jgi:hypothetical protein
VRAALFAIALGWPAIAEAQTAERVLGDGGANRVKVVILGEGYTAGEQADLRADLTAIASGAFAQPPFAEYAAFFDVYVVPLVSSQSGADHPARGTYVDTALDAAFDCVGVPRFICIDWAEAQRIALAAVPDYDALAVVVNDPELGGVTGYNIMVISTHPDGQAILEHELGHTLGNLADEYDDPSPGFPACNPVNDCSAANATLRTQRADLKWRDWIDPATPIPTPEGMGLGDVGLFEGARYLPTGIYRPVDTDCRMHFLDRGFCPVCTEAMIASGVHGRTSMLEGAVPTSTIVELPLAARADLGIVHLQSDPPTIETVWWVDGSTVATGTTSFAVKGVTLGSGPHAIEVRLFDRTASVRNHGRWPLFEARTWALRVGPDVCGDRLVSGAERCDDGTNDGAYDGCLADCSAIAEHCGDGATNGPEACDDGLNDGAYDHCSPGCAPKLMFCGDGVVNGPEACDGSEDCDAECRLLPPPPDAGFEADAQIDAAIDPAPDLGIDASIDSSLDAVTDAGLDGGAVADGGLADDSPLPAGRCGCQASAEDRSVHGGWTLMALAAWCARRRARIIRS